MTSEQEQLDINKMKDQIAKNNELCMMTCANILTLNGEELGYSGYKSQEDGVVKTVQHYLKANQKLQKDHVKKYPD